MTHRPTAVFAMDPVHLPQLFPAELMDRLHTLARIDPAVCVRDFAAPGAELTEVEVLITGWGCPPIDDTALAALPKLGAVLHTAGSVRALVGDAFWARDLPVSSAAHVNALPVAEFTLAAILFAAKDAFGARHRYALTHRYPTSVETASVGAYRRRAGLIGASRVGRRVLELLRPFDFETLLHDPYLAPAEAAGLGARGVDLDELLATSDIVSLHAPDLPETTNLLDRRRLALIPDGGVFINTARGALVDERALTEELVSGRLRAVLDVTQLEPLPADSPLYTLPNVFLTPHIAGSLGNELARLGANTVAELERYRAGLPLQHRVDRADLARVA